MITVIEKTLKKNGEIDLPAQGTSMFPFIREGQICRFIPTETSCIKKGEIVLFYSIHGQLIAHRLVKTVVKNNEQYYLFKGDSNLGFDELVREHQIIGKLSNGNGRFAFAAKFFVPIYSHLILSLPILTRLFRLYLNKIR